MRPLCSTELYSHEGVALVDHLEAVAESCASGRSGLASELRYIVGACHDFGKATGFFQEYLLGDRPQSTQTNHSTISGLACYFALSEAGFNPVECAQGWLAVTRHHSALIDTGGNDGVFERVFYSSTAPREAYNEQAKDITSRSEDVQAIYDQLEVPLDTAEFCDWVENKEYITEISSALQYSGSVGEQSFDSAIWEIELFAHLVAADKLAASGYTLPDRQSIPAQAVSGYVDQEFGQATSGTINEYREQARQAVETEIRSFDDIPPVCSLTLPTGLGKTLTGVHAALQIRDRKSGNTESPPRIIYALPYTAIIDQNFEIISDVLSNAGVDTGPATLLKHHYRSQDDYFATETAGEQETDAEFWRRLMLTNRWESEFVTTTFVQLLESLIVPSNRQSIKLPNLRDAVIILDEVQAVPVRYWDIIRDGCKQLAADWNCTFIAMTATQPGMFSEATPLVPNAKEYFAALDRVTFTVDSSVEPGADPVTFDQLSRRVVDIATSNERPDILVVCNTVSAARDLYKRVESTLPKQDTTQLAYLSSAVRPRDRSLRIKQLKDGTDHQRIVISTQVIEAGVDLSFDHIIRDFAPLDSIVQAAGRCNRHSLSGGGTVEIASVVDEDGQLPATLIYDSPRLDATRRVLQGLDGDDRRYTESRVTGEGVRDYFKKLSRVKVTDNSIKELCHWDFESARISLIPETYSADVYVAGRETATEDIKLLDEYRTAILEQDRIRARKLRAPFYDRVVSVSLYSSSSDRASEIQKLPYDHELEVYRLEANTRQYEEWYDVVTGFGLPDSSVDSRVI